MLGRSRWSQKGKQQIIELLPSPHSSSGAQFGSLVAERAKVKVVVAFLELLEDLLDHQEEERGEG